MCDLTNAVPEGNAESPIGSASNEAASPAVKPESDTGSALEDSAGEVSTDIGVDKWTADTWPMTGKACDEVSNADIAELLSGVRADVQAFSERAEFYENLVRQLQSRIELLRADQIQQFFGPVLTRMALLLTQAADSAALARAQGEGYKADVEFDYFHDALIESLDLLGVESVDVRAGDAFDRVLHASRKTTRTGVRDLDWTVARVLRQGLKRSGAERAFLPAQVTVYRYDAMLETTSDEATTNTESHKEGTIA